ncbi:DCL3A [Symbiodinium natans]|uniref:DCL3A protein n=1 Tax=Symbiodinium natans TaxID=878477 RepID=A0A812MDF7_9DINO|nr:DCL3A [Symbiodinium natans]
MPVKDLKKTVNQTRHVLEELGMTAFCYALRDCIVPQLEAHAEQLDARKQEAEESGSGSCAHSEVLKQQLPELRRQMQEAADTLRVDGQLTQTPLISGKAAALLQLLETLFLGKDGKGDFRGIVFVTQVALTMPLAHLLTEHFGKNRAVVRGGAVSGTQSMADSKRNQEMERFRKGELNVLICTNALEEGVDVSDCAFVIRFNRFDTTKSHIQGAGRARRGDAKIFYFDNDPHEEEGRAKLLSEVAKDDTLRLTEAERAERRLDATLAVPGVYPFYPPGDAKSEVNLYNCLQMVYEYCAKTMGQSFNPEDLFTYDETVISVYPRQVRKFITEVKYPSPEGFLKVTLPQVNTRWGDTKLESVLDPNRSKNMKQEDKDKRRFLYVVAIEMHEKGLLDGNNQPSGRALHGNKLACEAFVMSPGLRLSTASYAKAVPAAPAAPAAPTTPVAPAASAAPAVAASTTAASASRPATAEELYNAKGQLNEWVHKQWRQPAEQLLSYDSDPTPDGFVAKVRLLKTGREFVGSAHKKKDAEQSAAAAALKELL